MKKAEAVLYLDNLRPLKGGKCSVKIKITFNRKRKYVSTGIEILPEMYDSIFPAPGKKRTLEQRETYIKLNTILTKAQEVINGLEIFTFYGFEEAFFEQRNIHDSVSFAFDRHIEELTIENRLGTAESYRSAKKSLEEFKKGLTFSEITPSLLKKYEKAMLLQGKSFTTIGIYIRSLRTIYNQQNIDKSLYPFGEGEKKYSIPTGKNIKKALTIEEVAKIYNYYAPENSTKEMAKDYWLFLYLSNGMNLKDFCLLRWSNIEGNELQYHRAKTHRRTERKSDKSIQVALKPETFDIISKWGQPSISKDLFIFPHLNPGMNEEQIRAVVKQLTKTINKYMKRIALELGINKEVTTYFARHSFATVLKRSGTNIAMISELLGHSSVTVTQNYLDGFEKEQIQKETDVLTAGFRKAN